eukprot:COSAG06_NODE_57689_length_279_cov_1.138889_1_plen_85_part_00
MGKGATIQASNGEKEAWFAAIVNGVNLEFTCLHDDFAHHSFHARHYKCRNKVVEFDWSYHVAILGYHLLKLVAFAVQSPLAHHL